MQNTVIPETNSQTSMKKLLTVLKYFLTFGAPLAIATLIPTTPTVTKPILYFFAITVWAMFSWMFSVLPEIVVGFVLPILYIVSGVATANEAFSAWTTNTPWICFGGIMLGAVMMSTGLAKRIAFKAILITGGTFKRTLAGLMLGGLILAPFIPSLMAKIAIFCIVGVAICQALDLEPKSNAAAAVMLTAFLAVASPKLSYLTGAADNPMAMGLVAKVTCTMITWGEFALHNAILGIIYSAISLAIVLIMIKPEKEIDSIDVIKERYAELGSMTLNERKAGVALVITLLLMVTDFLHRIDIGWLLNIIIAVLFLPGIGIMKGEQMNKINFSMMFFITGAMSIGPVAAKVGAVKLIATVMLPLLKGSTFYTLISVYFFGVFVKFFLTPIAATAMFTTSVTEIALQLGLHPYPVVYAFKYGVDQYIFPYEYAVLLYAYSFGYIALKHVFKVLIPRIITTALLLSILAFPYWKWLGLL